MDYELQLKIKNAPLLNLMRSRGFESASSLSKATNVTQKDIGKLLNLKLTVYNQDGISPRTCALKIAEYFGVSVDELAPKNRLRNPLVQNTFEAQVNQQQIESLSYSTKDPSRLLEWFETETRDVFEDIISANKEITERQKAILRLRFVENKTLDECGKVYGVSRERIRNIVANALRKLRGPEAHKKVIEAAGFYAEPFEIFMDK